MLSAVALISGLYDVIVGALLLCAAGRFAAAFGVAPATPPIFSDLNGLFLVVIGIGYYFPWRDPDRYRSYMWLAARVPALLGQRRPARSAHALGAARKQQAAGCGQQAAYPEVAGSRQRVPLFRCSATTLNRADGFVSGSAVARPDRTRVQKIVITNAP